MENIFSTIDDMFHKIYIHNFCNYSSQCSQIRYRVEVHLPVNETSYLTPISVYMSSGLVGSLTNFIRSDIL